VNAHADVQDSVRRLSVGRMLALNNPPACVMSAVTNSGLSSAAHEMAACRARLVMLATRHRMSCGSRKEVSVRHVVDDVATMIRQLWGQG